jgi:hypothetical protein
MPVLFRNADVQPSAKPLWGRIQRWLPGFDRSPRDNQTLFPPGRLSVRLGKQAVSEFILVGAPLPPPPNTEPARKKWV